MIERVVKMEDRRPELSICIATFNRGGMIGETLDSLLPQLDERVEVVVVDGASTDSTQGVLQKYQSTCPSLRYFRETANSGVDRDYDKAVSYARGKYCWLMSDDDLLTSEAVTRALSAIADEPDLVILNARVKNLDMSAVLEERRLKIHSDRIYRAVDVEEFFVDTAAYLTFIGCVVMRRSVWMCRDRVSYYDTQFIHMGVIFQAPALDKVKVIAEPVIQIRYGNATWTPRRFEIWMFKFPKMIWSFAQFSDRAKHKICQRKPWRSPTALFYQRALGSLKAADLRRSAMWRTEAGRYDQLLTGCIGLIPGRLANLIMVLYCSVRGKSVLAVHDLLYSANGTRLGRLVVGATRAETADHLSAGRRH